MSATDKNCALAIFRSEDTTPAAKKGGRPPKFAGPRRPVTVTLPQGILDALAGIDQDRAQAIVKAVSHYGGWTPTEAAVEFVAVTPASGLLLVRSCQALRGIPWLNLAEIVPGRYLLVLSSEAAVEKLELALGDLVGSLPPTPGGDREVVEQLLEIIRNSRRSSKLGARQVVLVESPEPS